MTTNSFQPSGQSSPSGEKGRKGRKKKSDQTPQPYPIPPLYPAYPYGPPPINIINNNANTNTNKVSARQVVKVGRKSPSSAGCCAILVVVVLLIIGASIYQSVNSHFRSSGPPTTTQIPAPLVSSGKTAYNVNWSKGMSNWSGSAEWKVIEGGLLGSDGSSDATNDSNTNVYRTLAPYHPTIPDYAVEAQIQFIRFPSGSGDFGILTRTDANDDGYLCGFTQGGFSDLTPFVGSVKHGASNISSIGNSNSSFTMDGAYHTFLVEMNGNRITFFVDKQQIAQITDNTYLSPGRIGLRANNAVIDVRSFQVLVL